MTRYRRAVETRSVFLAELAAREAGTLPLHDALGLLELYAATRDAKYEAAACRWLGRFALERQPSPADVQFATTALAALSTEPPRALKLLRELLS
jgi:hypothetical protein